MPCRHRFPDRVKPILRRGRRAAFTLIELLVVIGIIVLMAAVGVSAFKGGSASDGTRGASYQVATLFDAARNEAIMRRVPVRVIFDVGSSGGGAFTSAFRRAITAYSTNGGVNWIPSGQWVKFPANAYFDFGSGSTYSSRPFDASMDVATVSFGASKPSAIVAYEYLPNGQANYSGVAIQPLKVIF